MPPGIATPEVLDPGYRRPLVGGMGSQEFGDAQGLENGLRYSAPAPRVRAGEHLLYGGSRKQLLCVVLRKITGILLALVLSLT